MKPLTPQQIEAARHAILDNARSLYADANLLLANGRYPRSYSLAILACEELAKLPMLARAATYIVCGKDVDWKKLAKRLQSHNDKLSQIQLMNCLFGPDDSGDIASLLGDIQTQVKALNLSKQDGFYVSVNDIQLVIPEKVITQDKAASLVVALASVITVFERFEADTIEHLKTLSADPQKSKEFAIYLNKSSTS